jgi:hypothetical protein
MLHINLTAAAAAAVAIILLLPIATATVLRGSQTPIVCNKQKLLDMAKSIKSPNTMYYVVSILSLKTGIPPHQVAECLGFIWHKELDRNKYNINVERL